MPRAAVRGGYTENKQGCPRKGGRFFYTRKDKAMEIKLAKPYVFEGKEYDEIDLTGMENLTVQDAIDAQGALTGQAATMILPERSTAYIARLAAKATGKPVEFFELLPVGAARKLRGAFLQFMAVTADEDTGMVLKLAKPYTYKGKTYEEVDMSGAAELTTLDMAAAENKLAAAGHLAPEPSYDYLYCCMMAARASGLDEAFFTGLPIAEALRIKNALNGDRFFG